MRCKQADRKGSPRLRHQEGAINRSGRCRNFASILEDLQQNWGRQKRLTIKLIIAHHLFQLPECLTCGEIKRTPNSTKVVAMLVVQNELHCTTFFFKSTGNL
ncbi:hypothetical protein NPIL_122591 [Nephila pilipes]|uniref:Uncharacterized protein n=1 Tax=Nephila pilipes TaxID=299642 RepID=A0A8X6U4R8_NEPPI|nr:hypothetical protein NPIL_122591 [Nephila pilipes]